MIVLNVIAWIILILSILGNAIGAVVNKTESTRVENLVLMLGYICTLIVYINK